MSAEKHREAMLTVKEVARQLGVSEKTVRRQIADRALPATRFGYRIVRVSPEDLSRFVTARKTC